jgi:hypothetical protein
VELVRARRPDTAALEALKAANAALQTESASLKAEQLTSTRFRTRKPAGQHRAGTRAEVARQQFTRDSREMLSCIQSLESENPNLRSNLGGKTKGAA